LRETTTMMSSRASGSNKRDRSRVLESSSSDEGPSAPSSPDDAQNGNPAMDEPASVGESQTPLVESAPDEEATQMPSLTQEPQRTQEDRDLLNFITDLGDDPMRPLDPISDYYTTDFERVPELLRNMLSMQSYNLPIEVCQDAHNIIRCSPQHIGTMDGAARSFVMIPHDDPSHYVQPYEGAPFTFVDR
jgi:hypothetical protein